MDIHCPHFAICPGCSCDEKVDQPPKLKEVKAFFSSVGIASFTLQAGSPVSWRHRAKLAVRGSLENPIIGLFEKGSHRPLAIPDCRVHHPAINQAVSLLREWMIASRIQPYDEVSGKGFLRYVQFAVERKSGRVQVALVLNRSAVDKKDLGDMELLWNRAPNLWHSLWLNLNTRQDNVIFGSEWISVFGALWLSEALNEQPVCFHPASFAQANLEMFERLLKHVEEALPKDADLVEFYAGVGAIGIAVANKCQRVRCVEINPLAKLCFDESCRHLPKELFTRLSLVCGKSADSASLLLDIDEKTGVVIVDPPRKGIEKRLLNVLCSEERVKQLVYISCGWEGFLRDCGRLQEAGWKISQAEAFLFFPGSDHLELLVIFEK